MEYKVFYVKVQITHEDVDIDRCPCWSTKVIFEDTFASRIEAIRMAQKKLDRQPVNGYVTDVWAAVWSQTITDKGLKAGKRIYNKYKND